MSSSNRSVLVTGANGFIGNAVCRAFCRSGWAVYGLVRREDALSPLASEEIIPVLGSPDDPTFLPTLLSQQHTFDVIVSTTEQFDDYQKHFDKITSMVMTIARSSNTAGVRPLLLFTSGCKDYGMTALADSPDLAPHTEESPLNPPGVLLPRTNAATKMFEYADLFDAVVLRPTTVFGRSGSYYGPFFDMAQRCKDENKPLQFPSHKKTVLHGTHVDDCAEAYVRIAEQDRSLVAGQCYNISSHRYETLEEIAGVLVKEYGLSDEILYDAKPFQLVGLDVVGALTGFSQWVGSEKIREEVGWTDRKMLFTQGIKGYRVAYEEALKRKDRNVMRIKGYASTASKQKI